MRPACAASRGSRESPGANLYQLPANAELKAEDGEQAVAEELAAAGSPYDSHPPPQQRIDWVLRIRVGGAEAPGADGVAWALFASRADLEAEMTETINAHLERTGAIDVPELPPFVAPPDSAEQ